MPNSLAADVFPALPSDLFHPMPEVIEDGLGLSLTTGAPEIRRLSANLFFDGIGRAYPL